MSCSATLEPGSWVRIKRGVYQDDLAQVDLYETNFAFFD